MKKYDSERKSINFFPNAFVFNNQKKRYKIIQPEKNNINNEQFKSKNNINKTYKYQKQKSSNYYCKNIINVKKIILFNFIIILMCFSFINNKFQLNNSKITLKINKIGTIKIFREASVCDNSPSPYPDQIYINGNEQTEIKNEYDLTVSPNEIILVWINDVLTTGCMFFNCSDINEIDLTNFDTSKTTYLGHMFRGCSALTSLDLSNFNTELVKDMSYMFRECSSLVSLDLSNFVTSEVIYMHHLFNGCYSLSFVNLSNFNTLKVTHMNYMFYNCSSLSSLDLTYFKTSKTEGMAYMFYNCTSLSSLDLSNFDFSKISRVEYMFSGAANLEFINLKIADIKTNINTNINHENLFELTPDNILLCSNYEEWKNLLSGYNQFIHCIDNLTNNYEFQCFKKIPNEEYDNKYTCGMCGVNFYRIENDSSNNISLINCYQLPKGYYLDTNDLLYKLCYSSCETCEINGNINEHNCFECKNDYVFEINMSQYKNCFQVCSYYHYYDKNINKSFCTHNLNCPDNYNKLIIQKNECIDDCSLDPIYKYEFNSDCYSECPNNTINNSFYCEIINETNIIYDSGHNSYEHSETPYNSMQSSYSSSTDINNINTLIENFHDSSRNSDKIGDLQTNYNNIILSQIILQNQNENTTKRIIQTPSHSQIIFECSNNNQHISTCNFDVSMTNTDIYIIISDNLFELYNEQSQVIKGENDIMFQITNSKNELDLIKNGELNNYNLSIIDLGQCELKLREEYNLNKDESLIYLKKETMNTKSSDKKVEYEIYEPYNKTKLNLSICEGDTINLYVSMQMSPKTNHIANELKNMGYDIFNINDPFYQDICTPYKSENNTDMLLSDRIDYIYNNDDAQCQANCQFSNYILNTQYINCTCNMKGNIEEKKNKFDSKKFYEIFYDVLKYSNFNILKCYKLVFNINVIMKNIGSIIVLITFIIYLICLIIHIIKGNIILANKLKLSLKRIEEQNKNIRFENDNKKKILNSVDENTNQINSNNPPKKKSNLKNKNKMSTKSLIPQKEKKPIIINNYLLSESVKSKFSKKYLPNNSSEKWNNKEFKFNNEHKAITEIDKNKKEKVKLDAFELNELDYEEAIKLDERSLIQIYWDLLKREHIIIFTFFIHKDYNFLYIKLARFVFLFTTDMTMNVFFFSDDSMHKVFLNYGKYDFIQQIPKIIYSTIVSQVLEVFICFLSMTDKYFYQIKSITQIDEKKKSYEILKVMKIKLGVFFGFTFLFFGLYWYTIAAFCAVYENTQIIFIEDSLLSFLLGLIYPLILYIIPTGLRKCAKSNPKTNLKCVYKLSDIIPFF